MNQLKILIVEDENIIAFEMKTILEIQGYSIVGIASSGEEAVTFTDKHRPDLIIMDIQLEGDLDGIDTAGLINEKYNIPIIFLTGNETGKHIPQAYI